MLLHFTLYQSYSHCYCPSTLFQINTFTNTTLPPYTRHTLSLLMPLHVVPVTLSLLLSFHPLPVTLSLLLPFHPVADIHTLPLPSTLYQSNTLAATALPPCSSHTLTSTALPSCTRHNHGYCPSPCTRHTLLLLMPFYPVTETLSLPLPFHPVLVTLTLLLPFYPLPDAHSHCRCPSILYQLHSHCHTLHPVPITHSMPLPFTLYQLHSHCYCSSLCTSQTLNTTAVPPSTSHTITATALQPVPVALSLLLPFHKETRHTISLLLNFNL